MVDFKKIIDILNSKRKSQAWLYKRVGISNAGWNSMKLKNDMRVSALISVAAALKVDPSDLLATPDKDKKPYTLPDSNNTAVAESKEVYKKVDINQQLLTKVDRFLELFEQSINKK